MGAAHPKPPGEVVYNWRPLSGWKRSCLKGPFLSLLERIILDKATEDISATKIRRYRMALNHRTGSCTCTTRTFYSQERRTSDFVTRLDFATNPTMSTISPLSCRLSGNLCRLAPVRLSAHVKFTVFTWATFCGWHRDGKHIFKHLLYNGFLHAKHSSPCRSVGDILGFGATQLVFKTIAVP
jgi:hypothetical protein